MFRIVGEDLIEAMDLRQGGRPVEAQKFCDPRVDFDQPVTRARL